MNVFGFHGGQSCPCVLTHRTRSTRYETRLSQSRRIRGRRRDVDNDTRRCSGCSAPRGCYRCAGRGEWGEHWQASGPTAFPSLRLLSFSTVLTKGILLSQRSLVNRTPADGVWSNVGCNIHRTCGAELPTWWRHALIVPCFRLKRYRKINLLLFRSLVETLVYDRVESLVSFFPWKIRVHVLELSYGPLGKQSKNWLLNCS